MRYIHAFVLALLAAVFGRASAGTPYPSESIYNLDAALTSQSGAEHHLDVYRGHAVLVTMFYGSCPAACPLLIDTLRAVERSTPAGVRGNLRVLMISIDPARDTVDKLQALARERRIDTARWTLARTDERTVRRIAALLNIQYRRLPGGNFNHASVVSVLTPQGMIAAQSEKLGKADERLLDALAAQDAT
jgi:protein SCO1